MTLFQMYELLELILNKDYSGNIISPDKFNQLIKVVNIDKFRKKSGLPEQYQPGRPIPLEYADITLKNTDDLRPFKKSMINTGISGGILPIPSDYAHRDSITYKYTRTIDGSSVVIPRPVEILRESQAVARMGNYTKQPTLMYPIGVVRSTGIFIYPATITNVDFFYYRWPTDPSFVYNQFEGYITYNAASSIEFEWPRDEHISLVAILLSYIGINLREADIYQYAELKKQKGE